MLTKFNFDIESIWTKHWCPSSVVVFVSISICNQPSVFFITLLCRKLSWVNAKYGHILRLNEIDKYWGIKLCLLSSVTGFCFLTIKHGWEKKFNITYFRLTLLYFSGAQRVWHLALVLVHVHYALNLTLP